MTLFSYYSVAVYFLLCTFMSVANSQLYCSTNKCGNNGQCVMSNNGEKCDCNDGFVGSICQFKDPCQARPCGSGGACYPVVINLSGIEQLFEYCKCYKGYSGSNCEIGKILGSL